MRDDALAVMKVALIEEHTARFNYLLRPSGAILATALKTSSKIKALKEISICVDLKICGLFRPGP
jgi:hypothetical protein